MLNFVMCVERLELKKKTGKCCEHFPLLLLNATEKRVQPRCVCGGGGGGE